jgi:hypothetical protein
MEDGLPLCFPQSLPQISVPHPSPFCDGWDSQISIRAARQTPGCRELPSTSPQWRWSHPNLRDCAKKFAQQKTAEIHPVTKENSVPHRLSQHSGDAKAVSRKAIHCQKVNCTAPSGELKLASRQPKPHQRPHIPSQPTQDWRKRHDPKASKTHKNAVSDTQIFHQIT